MTKLDEMRVLCGAFSAVNSGGGLAVSNSHDPDGPSAGGLKLGA